MGKYIKHRSYKKTKKTSRGRTKRVRSTHTSVQSMTNRVPFGMHQSVPRTYITKVVIATSAYIATSSNALNNYTLNLTSMLNPLSGFSGKDLTLLDTAQTFANMQPAGYTALSGLWQRYRVYGVRLKFTLVPQSLNDTQHWVFLPSANNGIGLPSTSQQAMCMPFALTHTFSASNTVSNNTVTRYYPIHQFWGIPAKVLMDEEDYGAVVGSSPVNVTQMKIFRADGGNSAMANACPLRIEITYFIRFETSNDNIAVS